MQFTVIYLEINDYLTNFLKEKIRDRKGLSRKYAH